MRPHPVAPGTTPRGRTFPPPPELALVRGGKNRPPPPTKIEHFIDVVRTLQHMKEEEERRKKTEKAREARERVLKRVAAGKSSSSGASSSPAKTGSPHPLEQAATSTSPPDHVDKTQIPPVPRTTPPAISRADTGDFISEIVRGMWPQVIACMVDRISEQAPRFRRQLGSILATIPPPTPLNTDWVNEFFLCLWPAVKLVIRGIVNWGGNRLACVKGGGPVSDQSLVIIVPGTVHDHATVPLHRVPGTVQMSYLSCCQICGVSCSGHLRSVLLFRTSAECPVPDICGVSCSGHLRSVISGHAHSLDRIILQYKSLVRCW